MLGAALSAKQPSELRLGIQSKLAYLGPIPAIVPLLLLLLLPYYITLGLYWDNGKSEGNYYNGDYMGYIGYIFRIMGASVYMETSCTV